MDIDFATIVGDAGKRIAIWTNAQHVPRVGDGVSLNLVDYQVVHVHWETQRSVTVVVRPA